MKITLPDDNVNDYTWTGLTWGKILAIKDALEQLSKSQGYLRPVQYDVLMFLTNVEKNPPELEEDSQCR